MEGTGGDAVTVHRRVVDWAVLALGCTAYLALTPLALQTLRLSKQYYPLKIRYPGLTVAAIVGGLFWFGAQVSERQLLLPADIIGPSNVTCWLFSLIRYFGLSLFVNSLLCKQYKQRQKYVQVEASAHSRWIVSVLSIPFIIFISIPASGMHYSAQVNNNTNRCGTPSTMWRVTSGYVLALSIPFALLIRSLSDPAIFFPNFKISVVEFCGLLVSAATLSAMSWGSDSSDLGTPSPWVTVHTVVGTIIVPVALFLYASFEPVYRAFREDSEYVESIEHTMRRNLRLPLPMSPSGDLPATHKNSTNQLDMGQSGEFFEVERLADLVELGDIESIKKWLALTNLSNVNAYDKEGCTPLHRAARNCNLDVLELLLAMEANPNAVAADGSSPIQLAAKRGSPDAIFLLHRFGAEVNAKAPNGGTALHVAIEYKQMGSVALLLSLGADIFANGTTSTDGDARPCDVTSSSSGWDWDAVHCAGRGWMNQFYKTPLTLALELGYTDIAAFLIDTTGVRVDMTCEHGWNAVQLCCALGHSSLVAHLLTLGDDRLQLMYENPKDRRNVFHYGAIFGRDECLALLITHFYDCGTGPSTERLLPSVNADDAEYDADISTSLSPGGRMTPLNVNDFGQASRQRAQLDSMLDGQDYLGRTPLHYAVLGGHTKTVKVLLKERVSRNLPDSKDQPVRDVPSGRVIIPSCRGYTALEYATWSRNARIIKLFEQAASGGGID